MKKLNRNKNGMIMFKPKNDDQNEKNESIKKNMISSPWLAEMNIKLGLCESSKNSMALVHADWLEICKGWKKTHNLFFHLQDAWCWIWLQQIGAQDPSRLPTLSPGAWRWWNSWKKPCKKANSASRSALSCEGRLGFADSFLHGRIGKLTLKRLITAYGRSSVMGEDLKQALKAMSLRLEHSKPKWRCSW